ncbi:thiamine pyrophosphokinase-related protein-like protein [Tricladium varicosporioides]|nr:thiamine pyrophosphokinase-related protein-like protein [Hymenoscyphus varicosporioides]
MRSNLELIDECDSTFLDVFFPYLGTDQHNTLTPNLYTLFTRTPELSSPIPVGYITKPVFEALASVPTLIKGECEVSDANRSITAFQQATEKERSAAVAATCAYWRSNKTFEVLSGWRNELYPVYGRNNELLFNVERSASPLFGVVTYGIHMSCFVTMTNEEQEKEGSKFNFKMWIPRRSSKKQTYGGLLDNTVAGGIASGESPFESMVREADEEASLPEGLVRTNAKDVGMVTYIYVRESRAGGENGLIQPEVQYVYDLELPKDVIPQPKDGEVEEFYLWTVEKVQEALTNWEFKPNCALCVLDFFTRHGVLTGENESDFEEIKRRCHREMPFPTKIQDSV